MAYLFKIKGYYMKKKGLFEQIVEDLFRGSSDNLVTEKNDTKYTYAAKQDLRNRFNKYYTDSTPADNGEMVPNRTDVEKKAKNIGVNLDRGAERNAYHDNMLKQYGSYEDAIRAMNPEVRDAITAMNKLKDPNLPKQERDAINAKWGGFSGLQRYRDMLDKMSLTPTYDQNRAKEAGINYAPFGTNYKVDGDDGISLSKKKAGNVVGYDYENLDLTDVPDNAIIGYFGDGTRANHHFGENENNPTYKEMAEMAKNGDENAMTELKNLYFKAQFNKLLNSKFGYDFKIPTAMYTFGNAKLPEDTLVINFTSAHRCPAWKECLVGYACYARGSEHNYEGLHKKNSNLHLMWESSHEDPELLNSMFRVIKMHLFNPEAMATALLKDPSTKIKWINLLNSQEQPIQKIDANYINNLANKESVLDIAPFAPNKKQNDLDMEEESFTHKGDLISEAGNRVKKAPKKPTGAREMLGAYIYNSDFSKIFDNKDIRVIRNTPNAYRGRFIRLNEEGDFIGQWLLDKFDIFAGELKLLGISTAAYTCRNLNYTQIKNIILNASTIDVGTSGEENGAVSKAIARRFFAVSENLYDSLDDTYVQNGRKIKYKVPETVKKGDYDGTVPLVPLHVKGGKPSVIYDLKPFTLNGENSPVEFTDTYADGGPTTKRRMYYKCPCGRHGNIIKNGKPMKLDCYLCRMCYEPKDPKIGEIYVLVKVHGDNIDSFNMDRANAARGINDTMSTYREARQIFGNRLSEEHNMSEKMGMKMVSNYGINSVKEHLNDLAQQMKSDTAMVENQFIDMVNRIDEAEKKMR